MRFFLCILILLIGLTGQATDYYCSDTGSNTNNGLSELTPFDYAKAKTIAYVAGDRLLLKKGGTYYGDWTITRSGSSGNPFTIGAYGTGANPIISGFTAVTAWTNLGSNIWESTSAVSALTTACNMVTVNGTNTAMGRYPNATATNGGYLTITSTTGNGNLTSTSLTGTPNWTGAEVVIRTSNFTIQRKAISSQSGSTLYFPNTVYEPSVNHGFFIQNDSRTLDAQNEWFYNASTKKISFYSTSQPLNIKIASVENLFVINANYITIQGITFEGANSYAIRGDDYSTARTNITIQNCTFRNIGRVAIDKLSASYFTVNNNSFLDCNRGAFNIDHVSNVTLTNNTVTNMGLFQGMLNGIDGAFSLSYVTTATIENNSIQNVGYNGITFYGYSITIKNNFVNNFCMVVDDGGGIYTYTGSTQGREPMTNIRITGNIVLNGITNRTGTPAGTMAVANGIYLDNNTNNVEVDNNSVAHCSEGCIRISQPININVHHNTFFDADKYIVVIPLSSTAVNINNNFSNNIVVAKKATDKLMYFYAPAYNYIPTTDTYDYNVYARPIDDNVTNNLTFLVSQPSQTGGTWDRSLPQFQVLSGQDSHSTKSPKFVTTVDDITFAYNATASQVTVSLPFAGIDPAGNRIGANPTLQPYSSVIVLKDLTNPSGELQPLGIPGTGQVLGDPASGLILGKP